MADFDEASDEAKIGAFDYVRADNLWSKKYGIDNGSFDHLGNNIKWTFEEAASWIRVLTENKQSLVTKLYALATIQGNPTILKNKINRKFLIWKLLLDTNWIITYN